jgi:fimbrial chaperone protein
MKKIQISVALLLVVTYMWGGISWAGVIIGGTRVVYDGAKREASLSVKNPDKFPFLIQAWTDADGVTGEKKGVQKSPFLVTPPVFRLEPGNENMLRIIKTGLSLPQDRESIYWMNVKSIPASARVDKNVLQISVKTRIKLIYRPESVKAPVNDDYNTVSFRRVGKQIQVTNPTPYYLSFFSMKLGSVPVNTTNVMVPPKGNAIFTIPDNSSGGTVSWQVINDFGGSSSVISSKLQ